MLFGNNHRRNSLNKKLTNATQSFKKTTSYSSIFFFKLQFLIVLQKPIIFHKDIYSDNFTVLIRIRWYSMWSVPIANGFCGFPLHCNWLTRLGKLSQFAICFGNLRYILFKESDKNTIYKISIKWLTKHRLNLKLLFVFFKIGNIVISHASVEQVSISAAVLLVDIFQNTW